MDDMTSDLARFTDLIDRNGSSFDAWPDAAAATWARRQLLASPDARQVQDEALRLEMLLASHLLHMDAALDVSSAVARVSRAVVAQLPRRVAEVRWWGPRIAAGFMMAVVAGGMFDQYVLQKDGADTVEMAAVDGLVFGPAELDLP
jgi:hypothetical protein